MKENILFIFGLLFSTVSIGAVETYIGKIPGRYLNKPSGEASWEKLRLKMELFSVVR